MHLTLTIPGHLRDLKALKLLVAESAQRWRPKTWPMDAGIHLTLQISISRPPSLPKSVVLALKRPAVDKLLVAVSRGLTGILFNDSSQLLGVKIKKYYCPSLTPSSVKIIVDALPPKEAKHQ
jgi:hypothetical protein